MKQFLKWLPIGAAGLALVALIVGGLAPYVSTSATSYYRGVRCILGYDKAYTIAGKEVTIEYLQFSFPNLLTVILMLAGIAALVVGFFKPDLFWLAYVAIGCFAVAAVFYFCGVAFTQVGTVDYQGYFTSTKEGWKLGAGAIVGGILAILCALAAATNPVLNLLESKKIIKIK